MNPNYFDDLHKTDRLRIVLPVIFAACFWLVLSLSYGPEKRDTAKCQVIDTRQDRYGVRVCVGMTKDEVVRAVGFPLKVVSADGVTNSREEWIYSHHDGRVKHLYFENELLVSVEE
jgi:hypothetical protein